MKLDENNQYGYAMTKPFLTGCYEKQKEISYLKEFKKMIDHVMS